MRAASSQRRTANWVIPTVLAIFLTTSAGFLVIRAVILVEQVPQLATQSRAEHVYPSRIQSSDAFHT
jgi:hypothetical protein